MATIKATLTIEVHYEDNTNKMNSSDMMVEAQRVLKNLANSAASQGLMGSDNLLVETWDSSVKIKAKN